MSHNKQRISIDEKVPLNHKLLSHHTSLVYGTSFHSKNTLFSFRRKNKSQQLEAFQNIDKQDIFFIVYRFIGRLVTDSQYTKELITEMIFNKDKTQISVSLLSNGRSIDSIMSKSSSKQNISSFQNQNENKPQRHSKCHMTEIGQNIDSQQIQNSSQIEHSQKQNKIECHLIIGKNDRKQKKPKISIMIQSLQDGSSSNFGSISSNWFSETSQITLSAIKLPPLVLTKELVSKIYEEPEPFLINLSLCLLVKFLYYSKMQINCENACWILSIGTIIAYKIYYDEPVEGLMESFSQILEIPVKDIKDLERYFLGQIEFQAVVTNQQFQKMLTKIISI